MRKFKKYIPKHSFKIVDYGREYILKDFINPSLTYGRVVRTKTGLPRIFKTKTMAQKYIDSIILNDL
jgi:hypothetical protein